MAEARSQESSHSLSDLSNELLDLNDLTESLMIENSPCISPDAWEADVDLLFNRMLFKVRGKKDDLKKKEEGLETYKKTLEEEYQNKIKDYEDRKKEFITKTHDLETEYAKKVKDFEMEKSKMEKVYKIQEGKIKLDVGGHMFSTSLDTLNRDSDSMIAVMFSGRHSLFKAEDGSYFIDRDGTYFRYILNYLRGGISLPSELPEDISILRELLREADYFQLNGLKELIEEAIGSPADKVDFTQEEITQMMSTLVRHDVVGSSSFTSRNSEDYGDFLDPSMTSSNESLSSRANFVTQNMTKCDLNFTNKTLNLISFAHTTFFHNVSFRNANLVGASFYGCEFGVGVKIDFSDADLTECDFRQCKGKGNSSIMNFARGGGLVSGASSDIFLQLVREKSIEYRRSKLKGALFDPKVYHFLMTESTVPYQEFK